MRQKISIVQILRSLWKKCPHCGCNNGEKSRWEPCFFPFFTLAEGKEKLKTPFFVEWKVVLSTTICKNMQFLRLQLFVFYNKYVIFLLKIMNHIIKFINFAKDNRKLFSNTRKSWLFFCLSHAKRKFVFVKKTNSWKITELCLHRKTFSKKVHLLKIFLLV